jgi:tetratricopeptide (TPR) repeat protein
LMYLDWNWDGGLQEYRRAIELAPGLAPAYHAYANALSLLGRHEEARTQVQRAMDLDPVSSLVTGDLAWIDFYARRFQEAADQARRALELEPNDLSAQSCLLHSSVLLGRLADAISPAQALMRQKGASAEDLAALAAGTPADGLRAYYEWNLRYFLPRVERGEMPVYVMALLYTRLGQKDQAIGWLQKALDRHASMLAYLGVEPRFDRLRDDPRFAELIRRVGLPQTALEGSVTSDGTPGARSRRG